MRSPNPAWTLLRTSAPRNRHCRPPRPRSSPGHAGGLEAAARRSMLRGRSKATPFSLPPVTTTFAKSEQAAFFRLGPTSPPTRNSRCAGRSRRTTVSRSMVSPTPQATQSPTTSVRRAVRRSTGSVKGSCRSWESPWVTSWIPLSRPPRWGSTPSCGAVGRRAPHVGQYAVEAPLAGVLGDDRA